MKKYFLLVGICATILCSSCSNKQYDIIVIGATPGGIMSAVSAANLGKNVLILERSGHIGGLPANGLGATDIDTRGATTGLFLDFVERIKAHYVDVYGAQSQQVKDCNGGYYFEPSVAEKIFTDMIAEYPNVTVLKRMQFDVLPKNVVMEGTNLKSITVIDRDSRKEIQYTARVFIDATYEGDLAAAVGIPYSIGREGVSQYNEIGAGKIYKFWEGPEIDSISTGEGDSAIQAYNFRLNLTKNPDIKIDFYKPTDYNRNEYLSLIDDINLNRQQAIGPMKQGFAMIVNSVRIPNGKVDANNQHAALISTDLPEENYHWPEADWEWRDKFAERLKSYTLGLIYFAATDEQLPESFKEQVKQWGFAKDEYTDNGNFPRQVYVREGRRIKGMHIFTANDALPTAEGKRPPVYASSITAGHYSLDSHATRKRESGRPVLEGFLSYKTKPYTVPIEVIMPRDIDNVLCPVPVSGTHIGFSTLRLEPCWMAMGQAAGVMAAYMSRQNVAAKDVPVVEIQKQLLAQRATLIYFEDVKTDDTDFEMVQIMGLKGYLSTFRADLNEYIDAKTLTQWRSDSGIDLIATVGITSRGEVLKQIYEKLK